MVVFPRSTLPAGRGDGDRGETTGLERVTELSVELRHQEETNG